MLISMFPLPSSFFVLFSWCRLGPSIDHNGLNFFCHGFVKQWYSFLKTRHLRAHLLQIIIRPHVCLWRLRLLWLLNNQRSLLFSLYWWWRSRFYRWFLDLLRLHRNNLRHLFFFEIVGTGLTVRARAAIVFATTRNFYQLFVLC